MSDVGCWMLDVGCRMLDVGCWMLDVGCWMLDVGNSDPTPSPIAPSILTHRPSPIAHLKNKNNTFKQTLTSFEA